MNAYPDASFLFGLYIRQQNAAAASAHAATMKEPIHVGSALRFEFAHGLRGAAFRGSLTHQAVMAALAAFEVDIDNGVIVIAPVAWESVYREAERLSNTHTPRAGHRRFDILHVATALTLGAKEFLTFDANQRKLATAEGLKVKP